MLRFTYEREIVSTCILKVLVQSTHALTIYTHNRVSYFIKAFPTLIIAEDVL